MSQVTPHISIARTWDQLEPSRNPNQARTDHIVLKKASAGTTLNYPIGQLVAQKDNGTNEYAKIGTTGYTGPKRAMKYPITIDENGIMSLGSTFNTGSPENSTGSTDAYWQGVFKTQDLVGLTSGNAASVGRLINGTVTAGEIELGAAALA